ncbi:MAG TPA: HNH endonuclease [Lacipirellulaceae bacterium]|jgi:hypothetical protein|nr:HNH endonuclease [Lacipirellulaceae bacterium]
MMDAELREFARSRAGNRCEYCRLPQAAQLMPFHVEHIIAKQHGGSETPDNLAWSCDRCNAYKGPNLASVDPVTGDIIVLFHPRRDIWRDHFFVRDARIEGMSPSGRATVRLLQMNARRRIEVRRELIDEGVFD